MGNTQSLVFGDKAYKSLDRCLPCPMQCTVHPTHAQQWHYHGTAMDRSRLIGSIVLSLASLGHKNARHCDLQLHFTRVERHEEAFRASIVVVSRDKIQGSIYAKHLGEDHASAFRALEYEVEQQMDVAVRELALKKAAKKGGKEPAADLPAAEVTIFRSLPEPQGVREDVSPPMSPGNGPPQLGRRMNTVKLVETPRVNAAAVERRRRQAHTQSAAGLIDFGQQYTVDAHHAHAQMAALQQQHVRSHSAATSSVASSSSARPRAATTHRMHSQPHLRHRALMECGAGGSEATGGGKVAVRARVSQPELRDFRKPTLRHDSRDEGLAYYHPQKGASIVDGEDEEELFEKKK